ncbi:MAG: BamA/TamA family outer membrane protein, partial [Pseudomonadota bacterium]
MLAVLVLLNPVTITHVYAFELFGRCIIGQCEDADAQADAELIDPKRYEIDLQIDGGNEVVETAVKSASELWRGRESPVGGSAGVISRARGDYTRILAALYNSGYYGGSISIRLLGQQAADLAVGEEFPSGSLISVKVTTGAPYTFGRADVIGSAPPAQSEDDRVPSFADVGFAPGLPAEAGSVGKAVKLARDGWRQQGYPLAKIVDRSATANHPDKELNVQIDVEPGQRATYGTLEVAGTERMDANFVARHTGLKPGQEFDPDDLDKAKKRLDRLGVFSTQKLEEGKELRSDGSLPMTLTVKERKLRRIGAGATISSIDGIGLETFWLHRNLFGKAERLRLDAKVSGLGTTFDYQKFDYNFGATFTKPGVFTPDTDLNFKLYANREVYDDYIETFAGGTVFLTQFLSDRITLNGGAFSEFYQYENDGVTQDFVTAGLTASAIYDTRDSQLDPTTGFYVSGELKPFYEFNFENFGIRTEAEARG